MEPYRRTVLFDLDGTLTNSKQGIINGIQYALSQFGIKERDPDKLTALIGPPLHDSFQYVYAFSPAKAHQAVLYYRVYYERTGMFENAVYPLIPELLKALDERGHRLMVATSKPTVYAERILRHFRLRSYFIRVVGSNLDGTRGTKASVIREILSGSPTIPKEHFVMVGDRKHDIAGAQEAGIPSIAVAYGFGSLQELTKAKPTAIVRSVAELMNHFCR